MAMPERRDAAALQAANDCLASLVVALRQQNSEVRLRYRMSSLLQGCHTQEETCQMVIQLAGELFAGHDGCLALARPRQRTPEIVARWGPTLPGTAGWLHEVADPGAGDLCIPLTVRGETLGLLCLSADRGDTGDRRRIRHEMALALGEAVAHTLYDLRRQADLRELAYRDHLTGLFNRRFLEECLDRELHRAKRQGGTLGLAVLDLDHFKRFNDRYGHEAGDRLLVGVGLILRTVLRQSDIACRQGGDEFVLVLPDSSLFDTRKRVEELRGLVRNLAVRHNGRPLPTITVSAGVAAAPGHGLSARSLLAAADAALYVAKRGGRDGLVCGGITGLRGAGMDRQLSPARRSCRQTP